ncbi:hypothetical protein KC842_03345, partial [Candidatus Nomurabacteria bacterium]|nr:hypothetical protein [Candidatus Nomurabacteria bacterium]
MSIRNHRHFIVLVILGIFCFTALAMFFFLANKEKIKEGYVFENQKENIEICSNKSISYKTESFETNLIKMDLIKLNVDNKEVEVGNIPPGHIKPYQ